MAHFDLTTALKRRFILELREFWAQHPKYRDSLVDSIQGKYSFDGRPQESIVVKAGSASPVKFSADNFQGWVSSYCSLTKVYNRPGTSIEWVREDVRAIQKAGGDFPSTPGIYYISVVREPFEHQGVIREYLVFYVDPLLEVLDEQPIQLDPRTYEVAQGGFHPGSLNVFELPGNLPLYEGINYSADPATGRIALVEPLPSRTSLSVDYYYTGTRTGPFAVEENGANNSAIPGVVLAFGRKAQDGDQMAVVVSSYREVCAKEYGGRFEMSLDIDVAARDVNAASDITDETFFYIQAQLRDRLSFEGMEIESVSLGGEGEEIYHDNTQEYFYTGSISATVYTDWSIRLPLGRTINRVYPHTVKEDQVAAALSDEQLAQYPQGFSGLRVVAQLGLVGIQDPYFTDRSSSYEMIR